MACWVGLFVLEMHVEMHIKEERESHNRPDVAQRVPGGLGSQIS